jgi:hypothetical protein
VIRLLGVAFVVGLGTAGVPLVLTHLWYASAHETYRLAKIDFALWWAMLLLASIWLGLSRPGATLTSAAVLELGFMFAIVLDIVYGILVGIPHTIWPIAMVVVLVLTAPVVAVGSLVGAAIGKWRRRVPRRGSSG